ncbi:MAG: hypothetical protein NTX43_08035, partial [Bacteroidetes bacterium]|nr:hypothetical protein [Bacteroidota bacterium]
MSRCPDCENINVSSLIPSGKGNGRCKECKGTGIDQAASALVQFGTLGLEGKNIPCKICSGTGQCQTCGGTGEVKYHHTSPTSSSSEDNSSDGYTLIAKIIGFILIVAAIVWFVFAVAIPLIAINLALITLLVGLTRKGWNKFFFPLSILGAIYIVLDYNYGWFTKTLVNNLSFFKVIIPIFFYINIVAGLTAAYFTVRNILNMKNPQSKDEGEFSKRNLVIMGCLLLIGGLTVGLQMYFHSYKNHETQVGSQRNNEISIVIPFKDIKNGVLKAGIRITVAVSIPDVIHSLSGYSMNPTLIKALQKASEKENTGTHDFVDLFFESFQEVDPNAKLASSFNTEELKGMIN